MPDEVFRDGPFRVETVQLDLPALTGSFGRRLHEAGVPVTPERSAHFARALTLITPISRRRLYWTARAVLVSDPTQVAAFDSVFLTVFGPPEAGDELEPDDAQTVAAPPHDGPPHGESRASPGAALEHGASTHDPGDTGESDGVDVPVALASDEELLRHKRFDALEPHELAQLYRLMTRLELATPLRRARRTTKGRHGERIDLRRTLRGSMRTGGDPIRLARRRRRLVRRRLVLLCDISGSMEPYARAYLQFLAFAVAGGAHAEAFVFATRLTRLTRALAGRNPQRAIERAARTAPDWSSGTRIGDALHAFNERHGRRGLARGAVVVILSDGWERGDPMLVGRELERLARVAYRIVWVNPRVSAGGFTPRAGGMAAALPHIDALVSGHSLHALGEVADAIGAVSWEPPAAPPELDEDEPWASATPVPGSSVAMPSGHGPSRGKTTPGWGPSPGESGYRG